MASMCWRSSTKSVSFRTSCHRYVTMLHCFFPQTKTDLVREEGMGSRSPSLPGRLLVKTDAKLVGRLKPVLRGRTPRAKLLGYVTGMVGAVVRLASRARRSRISFASLLRWSLEQPSVVAMGWWVLLLLRPRSWADWRTVEPEMRSAVDLSRTIAGFTEIEIPSVVGAIKKAMMASGESMASGKLLFSGDV